jgi:lipopolysaccharide export system permease protein
MKTVQRLYLKDFFKLLIIFAIGLSFIFSLVELIDRFDDFLPNKASAGSLILYALLNMPKKFLYLLPMSVLICSLYTFGQSFRRKEITAIKAAGGRLRSLFYPFILVGIILSFIAFLTAEVIAPDLSKRALELSNTMKGKSKSSAFDEGTLWLKNKEGFPVKIDLYILDKKIAQGIDIFIFGKDFLKERIVAEKAIWNGDIWVLENITKYDNETGKIEKIRTMNYPNLESPAFFTEELKNPSEMSISELYRYTQRLKKAGFNNLKLIVDLNAKITFPLINMVMMLLGISLSSSGKLGGGLFSAGLGLLISFFYWLGYTFMLSMGYASILPPSISAWTIPVVFGILSVYLFLKIPE